MSFPFVWSFVEEYCVGFYCEVGKLISLDFLSRHSNGVIVKS